MKTIERLKSDKRVKSAWSETDSGDGYWVMLKAGFADLAFDPHYPTHTIHEWTIKDLLSRMKQVEPCRCKECLTPKTPTPLAE